MSHPLRFSDDDVRPNFFITTKLVAQLDSSVDQRP